MKTIEQRIDQAKQEVLDDIKAGIVPTTVSTFAELHDYVDANEYGGLCDDAACFDASCDDINVIQDAVGRWLKCRIEHQVEVH